MKTVRRFALALAFGGMGAATALAQSSVPAGYPSTGRYAAPALLPLPELNSSWSGQSSPAAAKTSPAIQPVAYPASQPAYQTAKVNRYYQPTAPESVPTPAPNAGTPSVVHGGDQLPPGQLNAGQLNGGHSPANEYDQAASGCWSGDCGVNLPSCQPKWFGYMGGLVMTRDNANKMWTTYETGNNPNQLMHFPNSDYAGGAEVRFGRVFGGGCDSGCGCNSGGCDLSAVEFTYWGVWDLGGEDSIYSPTDNISSPINLGFVDIIAPGTPASDYFDNSREHRVSRHDEVHNVEINFLNFNMSTGCDNVQIQWLVGARFFKFDEFIQFGAVSGGNEFGSNGGINEAYLDIDVENNLYGVQVGGRADWRVAPKMRLFAAPKFGLFANDIDLSTQLYRGDGALATFASSGNSFNLNSSKTDVAFLGQIDIGTTWDFSKNWSATIGYRALAITGVALGDDQIPPYLAAEGDWTDVDSAGALILHGGFAGVEFRW